MEVNYCSVSFAKTFEGVYGTVPSIDRLLMLEYNEPWTDHPIEKNNLPPQVNHYLQDGLDKNFYSRILFIRNTSSVKGTVNLFAVNNRQVNPFTRHFVLHDYSELLNIDLDNCFAESGTHFEKDIFLVCTNGKTDKCCSKFGIPVYKALNNIDDNVWQCTHITGCRFAPNVVHLPYLHYYGHLSTDEMLLFHNALKQKTIYAKKYRGRTCYTHEEQAAEYFLRHEIKDYTFESIRLKKTQKKKEAFICTFYRLNSTEIYEVHFTSVKSAEQFQMNCAHSLGYVDIFNLISISRKDNF